jgi:hypothetical protein
MNGRGIQTLIEAMLIIINEIIFWAQNRSSGEEDKDHVSKG